MCDNPDGTSDGIIHVTGVPATAYTVTQTTTPSGYVAPAASSVTLSDSSPNNLALDQQSHRCHDPARRSERCGHPRRLFQPERWELYQNRVRQRRKLRRVERCDPVRARAGRRHGARPKRRFRRRRAPTSSRVHQHSHSRSASEMRSSSPPRHPCQPSPWNWLMGMGTCLIRTRYSGSGRWDCFDHPLYDTRQLNSAESRPFTSTTGR